jgi:hypothetical protein
MKLDELFAQLHAEGLVASPAPPALPAPNPWYVRAMLGVSGFIAALFVLGFVAMFIPRLVESPQGLLFAGLVLCTLAVVLYRARGGGDAVEQFALALSLAGQVGVCIALFWWWHDATREGVLEGVPPALMFAAFECALLLLVPNFLHRFVCALAALAAVYWALQNPHLSPLDLLAPLALGWASNALWLGPQRKSNHEQAPKMALLNDPALARPVAYACALVLLGLGLFSHWSGAIMYRIDSEVLTLDALRWRTYLRAAAHLLPLLWLAWRLTPAASAQRVAALLACLLLGALTWRVPYIASALLLTVLGFAAGNRLLLGAGVLALLHAVGWYYYSLDITLLQKSIALAATGAALLAARFLLLPRFAPRTQA